MNGGCDVIVRLLNILPVPHGPAPFVLMHMTRQHHIHMVGKDQGLEVVGPALAEGQVVRAIILGRVLSRPVTMDTTRGG